jgi:hypothetical protein
MTRKENTLSQESREWLASLGREPLDSPLFNSSYVLGARRPRRSSIGTQGTSSSPDGTGSPPPETTSSTSPESSEQPQESMLNEPRETETPTQQT